MERDLTPQEAVKEVRKKVGNNYEVVASYTDRALYGVLKYEIYATEFLEKNYIVHGKSFRSCVAELKKEDEK